MRLKIILCEYYTNNKKIIRFARKHYPSYVYTLISLQKRKKELCLLVIIRNNRMCNIISLQSIHLKKRITDHKVLQWIMVKRKISIEYICLDRLNLMNWCILINHNGKITELLHFFKFQPIYMYTYSHYEV